MRLISVITLFFFLTFSLVTVPRANATIFEGAVARQVFMMVSPSAVLAAGAGMALMMAINSGYGTHMIAVSSAGITALKNWWNGAIQPTLYVPAARTIFYGTGGKNAEWGGHYWNGGSSFNRGGTWYPVEGEVWLGVNNTYVQIYYRSSYASDAALYAAVNTWLGGNNYPSPPPAATVPQDYAGPLGTSQPTMPAGSVSGSPGAAAFVASGQRDYGITVSWLPDSEVGAILDAFGGTDIDPQTGVQEGVSGPTPTDNTITAGASQQIGLLASINNWLTNLLGIKDSTNRAANTLDNSLVVLQQMSAKLDNVGSFPQAAQTALDNIAVGTQTEIAQLDNVAQGIQGLSQAAATVQTISTRLEAVRDLAAQKFPFSIGAALVITPPTGGTYDLGALHLPGMVIPIQPFGSVLGETFQWMRTLIQALFWASTLFMIVRRVSSL